jgi:hypothetical protein
MDRTRAALRAREQQHRAIRREARRGVVGTGRDRGLRAVGELLEPDAMVAVARRHERDQSSVRRCGGGAIAAGVRQRAQSRRLGLRRVERAARQHRRGGDAHGHQAEDDRARAGAGRRLHGGRCAAAATRRHRRRRGHGFRGALECEREIARRRETPRRIFLEAAPHELFDDVRNALEIGRLVHENRVHRLDRRARVERDFAGEHLVQHDAEGEDVGAGIEDRAADLLGRHVMRGAHDHAGLRADQRRGSGGRLLRGGEAEVEDLQQLALGDEDVLRFQVAMDHALLMRGGESVCDLCGPQQRFARADATLQAIAQRLAFEQLHDQVRDRAAGLRELADVVERTEVRMAQRRESARLALEAVPQLRVGPAMLGQDLDRPRDRAACP